MGIRIQPREIDVLEDDPFKNDLLDRKEPAEILRHLVREIGEARKSIGYQELIDNG